MTRFDDDDEFTIIPPDQLTSMEWAEVRRRAQEIFNRGESDQFKAAIRGYWDWLEINKHSGMVH